ncbi:Arylsulfotransferase (ASST) [Planctomycetes bacterium Pla163]|uniref:Arylsulfotransferase (ASST) n=1 Tax=Rohdeia mirabilis TaxID=2528008 RepID=A0A518D4P0_9BACT|nr:Arylsulfotransferase (ASST) [Planctomycetes bacterium Pla163]
MFATTILLVPFLLTPSVLSPQDEPAPEKPPGFLSASEWDPTTPRGVLVNDPRAFDGLTFVSPINSTKGYLLELDGTIAHEWQFDSAPGEWAYLQNDGTLWRSARQDEDQHFRGGGIGGRLQLVAPDGSLLCDYDLSSLGLCNHHDIEILPNGHILVVAWERIARETAIANGRDPEHVGGAGLWPDTILELRPYGGSEFEIFWQWRAFDHLVQDFDELKANFGDVTNPRRIDVNGDHRDAPPVSRAESKRLEELAAQLEALGYTQGIGTTTASSGAEETDEERDRRRAMLERSGDFMHTNGIAYHPTWDLIAISTPEFGEVWVIDHSTSIDEARGSTGGRWGHGGDLLYRFGNPKTYGCGTAEDQHFGYQHDPKWLDAPDGTLRLTVFNNNGGEEVSGEGEEETTRNWSIVEELVLPFDRERGFVREEREAFGPEAPVWSYADPDHFYSAFISGAERLPNGNTLICSGAGGRVFEVTPAGETVWNYRCDLGGDVTPPDHAGHAPKDSLFRATRYSRTHPGIAAILGTAGE